ncbi:unnamed protein product [Paramecium primaurelia]|uniref:Phosphatidate cytidylyltransferase n=2 Tax=Paramecium TaxID=5884 RepID=A0A8S1VSF2_9CILI|nr:unnamed protein product [Paramecium primaurelia]CAD8179727.1 unnamed protein product [Paramecium pentaurelia]
MVNWTQRFITGLIGAPIVLYTIQNQLALCVLINVVLYLLHAEFQKLISNVLKHNCSDSDRWYVETMASSWFIRIPTHYFITMSIMQSNPLSVHLHMIISIFFLLLVRLMNYLKISDFLKQNQKTISDKFPSQMVEKKIQMLTFFQMSADIVQFILFVYPLNFVLIVFQYKQAQALNLIWLISAWQTDNGALFMGSMFGKTLFCPKISPNKTWEGVSGGIFLSVFSSLILSQMNFLSFITLDDLHTKHFLLISLIVSIASIFGDLIESFIKRVADVKDSGSLFPGHGGILDRLDSLCFSAPFVYLYIQIFMHDVLELA